VEKSVQERLGELLSQNLSRKEVVRILYLEKYPTFEITEVLGINSSELQQLEYDLRLFLSRCPVGHKLPSDRALHAEDAHYCVGCERWLNEATLKDEIELEIKRLKAKEALSNL